MENRNFIGFLKQSLSLVCVTGGLVVFHSSATEASTPFGTVSVQSLNLAIQEMKVNANKQTLFPTEFQKEQMRLTGSPADLPEINAGLISNLEVNDSSIFIRLDF